MTKLALITGASSGIGKSTAILFAQQGWNVIAIARRQEVLQSLADEYSSIVPIACDGGDGAAVIEVCKNITQQHGTPNVIIHCAGAGEWKEIEDTSPEEFDQMLDAPLRSAFHFNHMFVGAMIQRGSGRLLHINSPAGIMPWGGATGYVTTRVALRGLSQALHMDLLGTGVTSCNVTFGEVSSEYFDANADSHHKIPGIASLIPIMTPEDCSRVLWKATHSSKPEISKPLMLQLFVWAQKIAPWLVRWLIVWTQRKRA